MFGARQYILKVDIGWKEVIQLGLNYTRKYCHQKKFKLTSDKDWNEYVNILISEFDEYTERECVTLCES